MSNIEKPQIIVIAGPTAMGKSSAAVRLSLIKGCEVISADSMQVYRGMDIGTAKITAPEMRGVRHHLIDVMDIGEDLNVTRYKEMGKEALNSVLSRSMIPIICGGSGFYIQSLIYDIDFSYFPKECDDLRAELDKLETNKLNELLKAEDSLSFNDIDLNNRRRLINALIYKRMTGESIQIHNKREALKKLDPPYRIHYFVLFSLRELMYQRIEKRVDEMIEAGLPDEVRKLMADGLSPLHTAGQAIGYKEMIDYVEGRISLSDAIRMIKADTRHLAKRQLTWFKREKAACWIDIDKGDPVDEIIRYL